MEYTKLDVEKIMTLTPETKEIVMPEGVTEIDESAFSECRLSSVELPASLKKIGRNAFFALDALSEIEVEEGNRKYAVDSGCLYAKGTKRLGFL